MTDVSTGWTENLAVRTKARKWVVLAIQQLRREIQRDRGTPPAFPGAVGHAAAAGAEAYLTAALGTRRYLAPCVAQTAREKGDSPGP